MQLWAQEYDLTGHSAEWHEREDFWNLHAVKGEVARERKAQLVDREQTASIDQVAHIRVLLHEIAQAEEEWITIRDHCEAKDAEWQAAEDAFKAGQAKLAAGLRERNNVMHMCVLAAEQRRWAVQQDASLLEMALLELEAEFAKSRRRLHEYDLELATVIEQKEALLVRLNTALAQARERTRDTDEELARQEQQLTDLGSVQQLAQIKERLETQIAQAERRLEQFEKKLKEKTQRR